MTMPYDEYVERSVKSISTYSVSDVGECGVILKTEDYVHSIPLRELKSLLVDAWMAGLMHAHKLIDEVKK